MFIRPGVSHSLPGMRVVEQHEGVALLLKADFPQSHLAITAALGVTDYPASITSTDARLIVNHGPRASGGRTGRFAAS